MTPAHVCCVARVHEDGFESRTRGADVLGTRAKASSDQEDTMDYDHDRMTLSVTEAAKRLGISRAFAYELVARGELPCRRFGRRVVVPLKALEKLIDGPERGT